MKIRKVIFNRLDEAASDEAIQSSGAALGSLCNTALEAVVRINQVSLHEA